MYYNLKSPKIAHHSLLAGALVKPDCTRIFWPYAARFIPQQAPYIPILQGRSRAHSVSVALGAPQAFARALTPPPGAASGSLTPPMSFPVQTLNHTCRTSLKAHLRPNHTLRHWCIMFAFAPPGCRLAPAAAPRSSRSVAHRASVCAGTAARARYLRRFGTTGAQTEVRSSDLGDLQARSDLSVALPRPLRALKQGESWGAAGRPPCGS